jgi:putative SOS response-associated peptidase YedK
MQTSSQFQGPAKTPKKPTPTSTSRRFTPSIHPHDFLKTPNFDAWLGGHPDAAAALLCTAPEDALKERVVSKLVNSVRNEGGELLASAP